MPSKNRPRKRQQDKSTCTFEDGDEPDRCRAKSKRTGERCGQPKQPGYNVCYYHGAGGGRPPKHGRYSRRLGRFREAYETALASGEDLLDMSHTLALLDVMVHRAAERASQLDTPDFREKALAAYQRVRAAQDADEIRSALTELGDLLERGGSEDGALEALTAVAERLAVRQEKAWHIKLGAQHAINANDVMVALGRLVDIMMDEVDGPRAARVLSRFDSEVLGEHSRLKALPAGGEE